MKYQMKLIVLQNKLSVGVKYSLFWMAISGLTFNFLNPWVTLIPGVFCLQGMASLIQGKRWINNYYIFIRFMSKLVKSVTIDEKLENCLIELGDKTIVKSKI